MEQSEEPMDTVASMCPKASLEFPNDLINLA